MLLFHDRDWELALLDQALGGPAFYIGAVGSARAQGRLHGGLRALGHGEAALARLCGPVGLVPHMRDAASLAISTLAEVVRDFHALDGAGRQVGPQIGRQVGRAA